ncbi:porin [Candidatus Pelagibacter bacterium]|jgi:outer membrane protein OmpU|nr:porin [Candidatus Pelagibacter bacterium]
MNKFKKIGLSALAGSLVAMSASAEMSITGGASVGVSQTNETAAPGYYNNNSVKFTFSGETDGGLTVTQYVEIDGGAQDDMYTSVAGSFGTITFNQGGGSSVMSGWDDKTPSAYEEVWDIAELGSTARETDVQLINGVSGSNLWRYDSPSFNGVSVHAAYVGAQAAGAKSGGSLDAYSDFGIQIVPEMVEGLSLGYAFGEVTEPNASDAQSTTNDESTIWINYAYGPITFGYQTSDVDGQTTTQDDESSSMSIVYSISDNISVSYGTHELDLGSSTTDQESSGFAASYTMGGMSITVQQNSIDNVAGSTAAANDIEGYDLNVAFAF